MTSTANTIDTAACTAATETIRAEAKRLLEQGKVAAVIGYTAGRRPNTALPVIVTDPEKANELVFSPACVNNLCLYLTKAKKEVSKKGKLALVVKGCDMKALAGLLGESQVKREDVVVIGVACAGVYGANADRTKPLNDETIAAKCRECTVHEPQGADVVAGTLPQLPSLSPRESEELARLEAMTPWFLSD